MTTTTEGRPTARRDEPAALSNEVAELRRAVVAMREELDRRDVEQMELESVVEYLLQRNVVVRAVVWHLVQGLYGSTRRDDMENALYDGPRHEAGFGQAKYLVWRRPARRWSQFGSKQDLLDLAAKHGVAAVSSRHRRESIIRRLWATRALHGEMPGCVGPFN